MLLMWFRLLNDTRNVPCGVRKPLRPWLTRTGPRTTLPLLSSHAWFVDSFTQARAAALHGTPAAAADSALAAGLAPLVDAAATPPPSADVTSRDTRRTAPRSITGVMLSGVYVVR